MRRPIERPYDARCIADIILRDGSHAQCQRLRAVGDYCRQHASLMARQKPKQPQDG